MRISSSLAAVLSSVAILGTSATLNATPVAFAPVSASTRAAQLYHLTIVGEPGAPSQRVDMFIELTPSGYDGFLSMDEHSTALEAARVEDGILRATVATTIGRAQLSFHLFAEHPYGTLTVGSHALVIEELGSR